MKSWLRVSQEEGIKFKTKEGDLIIFTVADIRKLKAFLDSLPGGGIAAGTRWAIEDLEKVKP